MTQVTLEDMIIEAGVHAAQIDPAGYECQGCTRRYPPFAINAVGDDYALCADCLIDADRMRTRVFELTWNDIRGERAVELARTDWTQNPDVPAKTRLRWQDYRQAWRDITAQDCSPADVVRPTTPE